MTMTFETLTYDAGNAIAAIRLNRPQRLNALGRQSYAELDRALARAEADPAVRVVVLSGEGRAFCVGVDIKEERAGSAGQRVLIEAEQTLGLRIATLAKPVIAAIHGYALGAGAEMALACDFILMAEGARFGLPELGMGNFLGGGATATLPRLVGLAKAREMIVMGEQVGGEEAVRIGLANRCFPDAEFAAGVDAFAARVAAKAPLSLRLAKEQLLRLPERSFEEVLAAELDGMIRCLATRDWQEGVKAFAEKRAPAFTGE
jgi:enoyl-CoA hydratase